MKFLIFDAGPLISLTMNGLLPVLEKLKEISEIEFIVTPSVKYEIIDRPMKIRKYKLESVQMKDLLDRGVLKMSSEFIPNQKLEKEKKKIAKIINGCLRSKETGEKIKIIHDGESECLAFASLCKCENLIVIDERTTRLVFESPENLKKLMEQKLHVKIDTSFELLNEIKRFRFIRSSEVLFIAYKKELFSIKNKELLDALLYGVKFKGAAISSQEIEEMKKLI